MKSVSVINQPGGSSRYNEDSRIVGFRVLNSEIARVKGEEYFVTSPNLMTELAIQYLKDNGYSVEKVS